MSIDLTSSSFSAAMRNAICTLSLVTTKEYHSMESGSIQWPPVENLALCCIEKWNTHTISYDYQWLLLYGVRIHPMTSCNKSCLLGKIKLYIEYHTAWYPLIYNGYSVIVNKLERYCIVSHIFRMVLCQKSAPVSWSISHTSFTVFGNLRPNLWVFFKYLVFTALTFSLVSLGYT